MLQSLSECWQLLITDYGVLPSIIASATLAGLICILFLMLRSVRTRRSSKRASPTYSPDKKKKKRKGHARHRSSNVKAKSEQSTSSQTSDPNPSATFVESESARNSSGNSAPAPAPLTPSSVARSSSKLQATTKIDGCARVLDDLPESCVSTIPTPPDSMKDLFEKDLRLRTRVPSVSTVDTTAMSDDLSCGSVSIRSMPSLGAGSSIKSTSNSSAENQSSVAADPVPRAHPNDRPKRGALPSGRNKRVGAASSTKLKTNPSKLQEASSRWDALKPTPKPSLHLDRHLATAKPSGNQNRHHPQPAAHRPSNRRGGAGVPRKGPHCNNHESMRNPSQSNQSAEHSPVSPPTREHRDVGIFLLPGIASLPPPPPGLDTTASNANESSILSGTGLFPPQQKTVTDSMPLLVPDTAETALAGRPWQVPTCKPEAHSFVSASFLESSTQGENTSWNGPSDLGSPLRHGISLDFPSSPASSLCYGAPSHPIVKENPFAQDTFNHREDSEEKIEADLQELGGQMAGSILDF